MDSASFTARLTRGALSGFAGNIVIQGLRTASQKWLPATMPPMREEPGTFMVEQAEEMLPEKGEGIPPLAEKGAALSMAMGYGLTAGALYGLFCPRRGGVLVDGALLGLSVWAVGYLGWLPALGLTPPPGRQRPEQIVAPALRHVLFGVATAAAYQWLTDHSS